MLYGSGSFHIEYVADGDTAAEFLEQVIHPALHNLKAEAFFSLNVLLEHHKSGYLVSYHREFTDHIQNARQESGKKALSQKLHDYFEVVPGSRQARIQSRRTVCVADRLDELCTDTEGSIIGSTCVDALDNVQTCYEVCI